MQGKVAIVTGGAGGIGSAVCRAFAGVGVGVAVADMDAVRATETADDISSGDGTAIGIEVEVTCEDSVKAAVKATVDHFGRVDFLVHCAGNNIRAPVLELSVEDWSRALNTHLTGAFLFSKAVGKRLVDQGEGGRVVFYVVGCRKGTRPGARELILRPRRASSDSRACCPSSGPNTASTSTPSAPAWSSLP